ncbi:VC0807 family protein [Streptomyces sp. NPDC048718]|uniref:VC0807 family protein n=1 Tax=Streptomyces sp. NPDC048718 TaxID=3365587 RepID=UPI0037191035
MSTASQPQPQPGAPARSRSAAAIGWALTIGLNIVAPILTYGALTDHGWSEFTALLLSGVWPVLDTVVNLVWHRKLDEFAVITLFFLALTAVVSLVGAHSTRALLIKDSAVTGLSGALFLGSLFAPKPLMFYFGRRFATDGTPEGAAWWNGMWRFEGFRAVMRRMTIVWGVSYIVESITRVVLSYVLATGTMVVVSPILIYGTLGLLAVWTMRTAKRSRADGAARMAAAAATPGAAPVAGAGPAGA